MSKDSVKYEEKPSFEEKTRFLCRFLYMSE